MAKRKVAKRKAAKKVKKVRCAAMTRDGKRCKNFALPKSKYCATHRGKK